MRFLRKLVFYTLLVAVVALGGAAAAFFLTPSATIANLAAAQVKEATGRDLTLTGELKRTLFPVLGIETGPVAISNADWAAEEGPMASADAAKIAVEFLPLLMGQIKIDEIRLVAPKVRLAVAEDGRKSWEMAPPAAPDDDARADEGRDEPRVRPTAAGDLRETMGDLKLTVAEIVDGEVSFVDRRTGQRVAMTDADLKVALPAFESPLTVEGSAVIDGKRAQVNGVFDSLAKFDAGEAVRTDFTLSGDGVEVAYNGRVALPQDDGQAPKVDGDFKLTLDGDREKTAWLRALAPQLAMIGAVDLAGKMKVDDAAVDVAITGSADVAGQATEIALTAQAGEGWATGAAPVALDGAVRNALLDAGYKGRLAMRAQGEPPLVQGTYRLKAPDAQALFRAVEGRTVDPASPMGRLEAVDLSGDVDVDRGRVKAATEGAIRFDGRTVTLSASADGGEDWALGKPVATRLSASSPELFTLGWTGSVTVDEESERAEGDLRFDTDALRTLLAWATGQPVQAPRGTFRAMSVDARVETGPERAAATLRKFRLDDSEATGSVAAENLSGRPNVTLALKSGPLDLRPFLRVAQAGGGGGAAPAPAPAPAPAGGGWSDAPIDYSPLDKADATFDIELGGVRTPNFALGATKIVGTLKAGVVQARIDRLGLYGGDVVGTVSVDGPKKAIGVNLRASGVQLLPVLRDFADTERLEGTGSGTVTVTAFARSVRQLMQTMNGTAAIDFRDGALIGVNIAAMMRNIGSAFTDGGGASEKTDFASLTASFAIKAGVATNSDLAMLGPLVRLTGAGTIDLGGQRMDYRATPKAVASIVGQGGRSDLSGIAVPVLITGPWSNLSYRPDLSGAIQGAITNPGDLLRGLGGATGGGDLKESIGGAVEGGAAKEVLDKVLPGGGGGGGDEKKPSVGGAIRGLFGQ